MGEEAKQVSLQFWHSAFSLISVNLLTDFSGLARTHYILLYYFILFLLAGITQGP